MQNNNNKKWQPTNRKHTHTTGQTGPIPIHPRRTVMTGRYTATHREPTWNAKPRNEIVRRKRADNIHQPPPTARKRRYSDDLVLGISRSGSSLCFQHPYNPGYGNELGFSAPGTRHSCTSRASNSWTGALVYLSRMNKYFD